MFACRAVDVPRSSPPRITLHRFHMCVHCKGEQSYKFPGLWLCTWRYREEALNNIEIMKSVNTISDPANQCTSHCQYRYCLHPSRKYTVPQPACPHSSAEAVRSALLSVRSPFIRTRRVDTEDILMPCHPRRDQLRFYRIHREGQCFRERAPCHLLVVRGDREVYRSLIVYDNCGACISQSL